MQPTRTAKGGSPRMTSEPLIAAAPLLLAYVYVFGVYGFFLVIASREATALRPMRVLVGVVLWCVSVALWGAATVLLELEFFVSFLTGLGLTVPYHYTYRWLYQKLGRVHQEARH